MIIFLIIKKDKVIKWLNLKLIGNSVKGKWIREWLKKVQYFGANNIIKLRMENCSLHAFRLTQLH